MPRKATFKDRVAAIKKETGIKHAAAVQQAKREQQRHQAESLTGQRQLWNAAFRDFPANPVTDRKQIRGLLNKVFWADNYTFFAKSGGISLDQIRRGPGDLDELWIRGGLGGNVLPRPYPRSLAYIKQIEMIGTREMSRSVLITLKDLGHEKWTDIVHPDGSPNPRDEGIGRSRLNRGTLLVAWRCGPYNGNSSTHDARHMAMSKDDLSEYLDNLEILRELRVGRGHEKPDDPWGSGPYIGRLLQRFEGESGAHYNRDDPEFIRTPAIERILEIPREGVKSIRLAQG